MTAPARAAVRLPPLRVVAAVAVAGLSLVPVGYIVLGTVGVGPAAAAALLWRPRVGELLVNTAALVALGTGACAVLGTATAWLVERTSLPGGRRLWTGLMAAPLAVPAFVNGFGWYSLLPGISGLGPALAITTLSYFPLVHLPVAAVLRGTDPAFEDLSRALGNGNWRTFARVVLPQLRPALLGGTLLVGLHLLAEFGALVPWRFPTFATAVYDQYQSTFAGSAATALAAVLVAASVALLAAEWLLVGRLRVARLGAGAARRPPVRPLGRWALPATGLVAGVAMLAVGVPLANLARWFTLDVPAGTIGLDIARDTATSVALAAAGAAVTVAAAFPVAWLAVRHGGLLARLLERSTYLAGSVPGIVVALAVVTFSITWLPGLYQSAPLLVAAYGVLFLPRAMVAARAALAQVPPELDDAARALGATPAGVLWRVTVPLVARGLGAGAALVFLAVLTELTATLLLAPIGTRTLATGFFAASSALDYGGAAPYALLLVVVSAPAAYLLTRDARQEAAR